MKLDIVKDLGFEIKENVLDVIEIRDIQLDSINDVEDLSDYGYISKIEEYEYSNGRTDFSIIKDNVFIEKAISIDAVEEFFLTGEYKKHLSVYELDKNDAWYSNFILSHANELRRFTYSQDSDFYKDIEIIKDVFYLGAEKYIYSDTYKDSRVGLADVVGEKWFLEESIEFYEQV